MKRSVKTIYYAGCNLEECPEQCTLSTPVDKETTEDECSAECRAECRAKRVHEAKKTFKALLSQRPDCPLWRIVANCYVYAHPVKLREMRRQPDVYSAGFTKHHTCKNKAECQSFYESLYSVIGRDMECNFGLDSDPYKLGIEIFNLHLATTTKPPISNRQTTRAAPGQPNNIVTNIVAQHRQHDANWESQISD